MTYVPDRGDVVWLNFNPIRGHEQKGRRPAVVLSSKLYNQKAGLAFVCPITSQRKNYPFEVLMFVKNVESVVLSDQLRSVDWVARKAMKIGKAPPPVVAEICDKLRVLLLEP